MRPPSRSFRFVSFRFVSVHLFVSRVRFPPLVPFLFVCSFRFVPFINTDIPYVVPWIPDRPSTPECTNAAGGVGVARSLRAHSCCGFTCCARWVEGLGAGRLACWRVGDEWCVGVGLSVGVGRWYGCRGCWMSGVRCSDASDRRLRPVLLREYFSRSPRLTSAYSSTHLAIASDSTQPSSRSSILCLPPLPVRHSSVHSILRPLHPPSTPLLAPLLPFSHTPPPSSSQRIQHRPTGHPSVDRSRDTFAACSIEGRTSTGAQ